MMLLIGLVLASLYLLYAGATTLRVQLAGDIVFGPTNATIGTHTAFAELVDAAVPATTLTEFDLAFPVTSKLDCVVFYSDVDMEVQLNVHSGLPGTGASVIVLKAGIPAMWYAGCGYSLSALVGGSAITKVYAYVPGTTAAAKFNVRAQYDSTP